MQVTCAHQLDQCVPPRDLLLIRFNSQYRDRVSEKEKDIRGVIYIYS